MNEQLKKRLIGATVLVLLAVIFVPMLFNSGEKTEMPTFGSNVPPKPEGQFQTIEVPLQTPAPQAVETRPVTTAKDAAAIEAQTAAAAPAPAVAATPAPATPVATPAPATPVKPAAAPAPAPVAQAAPVAKPSAPTPPPAKNANRPESGWAVQLGNFSRFENARALREKLRKKGFSAYVEHQKNGYRVRVGPELKRENADTLKARLEKAGFKGVVMPHP